jgi:hypothetical protein
MSQPQFVTELLNTLKSKYQLVLDDAVEFFAQYKTLHLIYAKESKRFEEIQHQLTTIYNYKKKHNVFPKIKGHSDAKSYLLELEAIKQRSQAEVDKIEPEIFAGFKKRQALLNDIATSIAKSTIHERDASQFIATMMLRAPLPADHNRCEINEKTKPIYISALVISLLTQLIGKGIIDDDYIISRIPSLSEHEKDPDLVEHHAEELNIYITEVLNPIIIAALLQNIGSYCMEAEAIYQGDRFQALDEDDRKVLIKTISENTNTYLNWGYGKPLERYWGEEQLNIELDKFDIIESIVKNYPKSQDPMGNLLRIPMIYSSFTLSTKHQHDFRFIFKAYDILNSGIEKKLVYQPYAEVFLNMVGKYPLGSGISFISLETGYPERAIVSALNPPEPTTAVVKQLTRRQVYADDHTQVAVTKDYIVSNSTARKNSEFDTSYYKKQYPNGYFWNPSEAWQIDLEHKKFWRRDNRLKPN